MKKKLLLVLVLTSLNFYAQIGIGTINPSNSSVLDLSSNSKGFLPPRMTNALKMAIPSPPAGLMVWCTDCSTSGEMQVFNGVIWNNVTGMSPTSNGTAVVNGYSCTTSTSGALIEGIPVSGVTQTITANVASTGTYSIFSSANGVTFAGAGIFINTGMQNIVLTAMGTPIAIGTDTFTLGANPNCNFTRSTVNAEVASILAQIGDEGDFTNTVPSVVSVAQLSTIGIIGLTATNQAAYQAYIDANPTLFSSPATAGEVQAAVTAVNAAVISILAQIGNEGDSPNTIPSVVTVAQLSTLGITGLTATNQVAYQAYIDANPNLFSSPATAGEVQAAVTAVNASVISILAQIGNEGDSPNTVPSEITTAQLINLGITGVVATNQSAYQAYIDANPNIISFPATVSEVQAVVMEVNALVTSILSQIGNEGDSPNTVPSVITSAQLSALGITGVTATNQAFYQVYIDNNPALFTSPATLVEIQAMVNTVNGTATTILAQIGIESDSPNIVPSVITTAQLAALAITGLSATNQAAYQAYIDANPNLFSSPATAGEVQAAVTAVNASVTSILAQIGNEGDSPNLVSSVLTVAQLSTLGITGLTATNQAAYQAYIDANPNLFASPATIAEVQAAVTAVNVILEQIGNEGDSTNTVPSVVTVSQLTSLGITGVLTSLESDYQTYIDANPILFSSPATFVEVQTMVNVVNAMGKIVSIDCAGATNIGTLKVFISASGTSSVITYTGGDGGIYSGKTIASTGVTGLIATLVSGSFTTGSGTLTYVITGTPNNSGTASFAINIGGKTCTLIRTVVFGCIAKVDATTYKEFMCHNLGANTTLDPNTPVQAIHGNYYQWGRITPVANASTSEAGIVGWNTTFPASDSWLNNSKTVNDPCPSGYRVPTQAQWTGMVANNSKSLTGSWTADVTNFGSAIHFGPNINTKWLTLPAAGLRDSLSGVLSLRGSNGFYWLSGTSSSFNANYVSFSNTVTQFSNLSMVYGLSVRCIAE